MTIAIDDVCTHADLDNYLGNQLTQQTYLLPTAWSGDSTPARQWALDRTVEALRRRRPPILEADIADVTELKQAVLHGASMRLYDLAMTSGGDAELWHVKMKAEEKRFAAELEALQPTGLDGETLPPGSIGISRR